LALVVVVEDDPETALLVQVTFDDAGHDVVIVTDPAQVLPTLLRQEADALVLDIMLPGASGYEILATLRETPETANLPVLLLSSLTDSTHRIHGLRQGAADYLTKPFEPAELLLRVERLLVAPAMDEAALGGNLQDFPFWELLQSLHQGRRTGILEIPEVSGRMELSAGVIVGAEWGHLTGHPAALALSGLDRGRFRFHPKVEAGGPAAGAESIAIGSLLMTAAVLRDELDRLREYLPAAEIPLEAQSAEIPPIPETFEGVPIGILYVEILQKPGTTLAQLLQSYPAAPQQIRLAVAWLSRHGLLRPRPETPSMEASAKAPSQETAEQTGKAGAKAAPPEPRAAPVPAGPRHLLLLCQPEAWEELLQRVSVQPSQGPWHELYEQLSLRQGGTAKLEGPPRGPGGGPLSLHVQILSKTNRGRIGAILPLCHGVAIWLGGPASMRGIEDLINQVEALSTAPHGILLAPSEDLYREALQRVHGSPVWQVVSSVPEDLWQLAHLLS
jgi:CheY-like chemotaxis protein